ncbi:hypothetical protein LTR08_000999 [Meristemomyces frigidus]|nr:hypothetical protein LTR08_000999 [Meristemomyces frigidus]
MAAPISAVAHRAASAALPFPAALFKPAASIIKPWKAIAGAREWQTSAYHYNKQTIKTLPTAAVTADKLLQDYSTMTRPGRGGPLASSASSSTARSAIAIRRKSAEKMYVSGTTAKDFGDRIVIKAYVFDGVEAARDEIQKRSEARKASGEKQQAGRRRPGGGAGAGAGARRTGGAPMGARTGGASTGVRRFTPGAARSPGPQGSTGAGR